MKKTNLLITGLLVLIAFFAYLYFSGSISFFTQSTLFNLPNQKLIVTDDNGTLQFISTEQIDAAINNTVNSLDASLTPLIQKKLDTDVAATTYLSEDAVAENYVPYNSSFRLTTQWSKGINADKGGTYAKYYKGRTSWNPWNELKDDDKAYWLISRIP